MAEKKRRWENKKRVVALATREERDVHSRRAEGEKERGEFFFSSRRGGENRSKMREKRKKAEEGKNQKKAPKKDSTSPHNKF